MSEEPSRRGAESAAMPGGISAAPPVPPREIRCANCGAPVAIEHEHCPQCGALARPERLTFRTIFQTSIEHFLSLDIPLARTYFDLFWFPGRVASDYIAGRRKVYANPLKYNLIAATVIVAVIHVVMGGQPAPTTPQLSATPIGRFLGQAFVRSLQWHNDYLQLIYIVTLPLLAWLLRVLLGRRCGRNTMELYVMCLYAFGHLYLFQAGCIMLGRWLNGTGFDVAFSVVSGLSPYVYFPWTVARFSRGGVVRSIAVSLLAFVVFSTVLMMTLLGLAIAWLVIAPTP